MFDWEGKMKEYEREIMETERIREKRKEKAEKL